MLTLSKRNKALGLRVSGSVPCVGLVLKGRWAFCWEGSKFVKRPALRKRGRLVVQGSTLLGRVGNPLDGFGAGCMPETAPSPLFGLIAPSHMFVWASARSVAVQRQHTVQEAVPKELGSESIPMSFPLGSGVAERWLFREKLESNQSQSSGVAGKKKKKKRFERGNKRSVRGVEVAVDEGEQCARKSPEAKQLRQAVADSAHHNGRIDFCTRDGMQKASMFPEQEALRRHAFKSQEHLGDALLCPALHC